MIRKITILGATGSIGTQALEALKNRSDYELVAVSCNDNIEKLANFFGEFDTIKFAAVGKKEDAEELSKRFPGIKFFSGESGIERLINKANSEVYLNAISGFAGVGPSIHILKEDKVLLLANKETLVCAGEIVNNLLDDGHGKLVPIDSEHVAISKCLYGKNLDDIEQIVITASGGSFFNYSEEQLEKVTIEEATKNPNWEMGKKITIDSNLMMNKCYELIEAYYLFRIPFDKINARVNRESVVHGYVRFIDETKIDVSEPDMLYPIEYALDFGLPKDLIHGFPNIERNCLTKFKFEELSYDKYPVMNYAKFVVEQEGDAGCVLNAADEIAVNAFLNGEIKYIDIIKVIDEVMKNFVFKKVSNYKNLVKADKKARVMARKFIDKMEK
jgi:1-deoxy-D-xylulose-5-phosphate reductoisomerase